MIKRVDEPDYINNFIKEIKEEEYLFNKYKSLLQQFPDKDQKIYLPKVHIFSSSYKSIKRSLQNTPLSTDSPGKIPNNLNTTSRKSPTSAKGSTNPNGSSCSGGFLEF